MTAQPGSSQQLRRRKLLCLGLLCGVRQGANPVRVVLAGAAFSVVLGALTQIIVLNSNEEVFISFRQWAVGSFQGRGYDVLYPVTALIVVTLALSPLLATSLDTVALGEDISTVPEANPARVFTQSALVVMVSAGAATAAGSIGFIGLTARHIARFITGPLHTAGFCPMPCSSQLPSCLPLTR